MVLMERLYAQFENNIWLDLSRIVALCPGDFLYGKPSRVPSGVDIPFGDGTMVKSVLVTYDAEARLYSALVVAGKVTHKAVQVVIDTDGALEKLIKSL